MKLFLNDSQKAIIIATLNNQQKLLSDTLLLDKLSKQESVKLSHIHKTYSSLLNYINETIKHELNFSRQQLAMIAFSLTSFEETCNHLLNETEKMAMTDSNMKDMIELMLRPTLSCLTIINNALKASEE